MIVATAGHVDHCKTLLVKALTGVDTDRLPEEKARGLTIELGFAYHQLGDADDGALTGFVDVPGHERFIRAMVAGVSGIDVVLFVVAADDGPMPQTAEHLAILDLLQVERGVVALTKIDRVSAARVAEVTAQIRALLANTALADCPLVPVSALTGAGIDALRDALRAHERTLPPRPQGGNFRLAVDRSFLLKGAGRVVTGTVFSGAVEEGATLHHAPGGAELRVRGIHAQNRAAPRAHAGQRCALNVVGAGLRDGEIHRGDWMVAGSAAFTTKRIDADIRVLASEARALANRTPVHVHIGAADVTARVVTYDGSEIAPGAQGLVHLQLDRELHAVRGDRVILRDQSARRTIGGGVVLDPEPDVRGRGRDDRRAYSEAMRAPDAATALAAALPLADAGLELARFARGWNLTADEADAVFAAVPLHRCVTAGGEIAIATTRREALAAAALAAVAAFHKQSPEQLGIGARELARSLRERLLPGVLDAVQDELVAAGSLVRDGAVLRLPGHSAKRSPADEAMWKRVRPLLERAQEKAPVVHDMAEPLRIAPALLDAFLQRMARQGMLVKVSPKRYFLPETMARFEAVARETAQAIEGGRFTAAEFRDRAGIGRNAVIEILEYFDRIGLTHRNGQTRTLMQARRPR